MRNGPASLSPESFLPVKPIELLVLAVLAEGQRHGYRIRQEVLSLSDGAVELEASNLYRHLRALHAAGLIEPTAHRMARNDDDQRRRYFKLSVLGRQVLAAEAARLRSFVKRIEKPRRIAPTTVR